MTEDEILSLEAGEKLDRLVAAEVLQIRPADVLHYSTDISDAWQVVEKLSGYGWFYLGRGNGKWHATVRDRRIKWGQTTDAACSTPGEAICKAALLARLQIRKRA
jgi:hypothetical protein